MCKYIQTLSAHQQYNWSMSSWVVSSYFHDFVGESESICNLQWSFYCKNCVGCFTRPQRLILVGQGCRHAWPPYITSFGGPKTPVSQHPKSLQMRAENHRLSDVHHILRQTHILTLSGLFVSMQGLSVLQSRSQQSEK